jgi:spore coat polysaccharide biosynthesis protein SpsF
MTLAGRNPNLLTHKKKCILMSVVAIIQARMGSTRLRGKVLRDIAGETLLFHVVSRVLRVKRLDNWMVATTTTPADDKIEELCTHYHWLCFRGDEEDVLDRYYQAAKSSQAQHIVRITADCPLVCPTEADRVISRHLDMRADYTHNITVWGSGMPLGTGSEILTFEALEVSWHEGKERHHREHVDEYVYEHQERFHIERVSAPPDLHRPELRLTIDTAEDLQLIRGIYQRLYQPGSIIELRDVIRSLDNEPELLQINQHVLQKQV